MSNLLTPKFLAPKIIKKPLDDMLDWLVLNSQSPIKYLLHRQMCHVTILAPAMNDGGVWPNFDIKPTPVYDKSIGDKDAWPYPFEEIACGKALQLWQGRNDGSTDIMPHLLFAGDTPFWGGVERERLVAVCSGFKEHVDRLVAGIMADTLICVAREAWLASKDKKDDVCFLT